MIFLQRLSEHYQRVDISVRTPAASCCVLFGLPASAWSHLIRRSSERVLRLAPAVI